MAEKLKTITIDHKVRTSQSVVVFGVGFGEDSPRLTFSASEEFFLPLLMTVLADIFIGLEPLNQMRKVKEREKNYHFLLFTFFPFCELDQTQSQLLNSLTPTDLPVQSLSSSISFSAFYPFDPSSHPTCFKPVFFQLPLASPPLASSSSPSLTKGS